jgi:glyoxalase family protein
VRLGTLHHVTAICSDARRTVAFYRDLGLKLVKRTVNLDDPRGYHLYLDGDDGKPGSLLTFLEWKRMGRGRLGRGFIETIGLTLPSRKEFERIEDPDGLRLEILPGDRMELTHVSAYGDIGHYRDLLEDDPTLRFMPPPPQSAVFGAGVTHHAAWRVADDEELAAWRAHLVDRGLRPTKVFDRTYHRSVYFRMPDGLLLELATDGPGLAVDEAAGSLGSKLILPPALEPERAALEYQLPAV